MSIKIICKHCNGTGFIDKTKIEDGIKYDYVIECIECKKNRENVLLEDKLHRAGIPLAYQHFSFSSYIGTDENKSKEILMNYADRVNTPKFIGMGVYIAGGKSCQKTAMLCVLGKELLRKNMNVKFITARDLVSLMIKISGFANKETESLEDKFNQYNNCEFLLIDGMFELGTTSYWKTNEELVKAEWNKLLRYRAGKLLQTAITSSFTMDQVETQVSVEISAILKNSYKELLFKDSIEQFKMNSIGSIFDIN